MEQSMFPIRYLPFSVLLLFLASCAHSPNTLTPREKSEGWHLLFDGQSTNGWHVFQQSSATGWTIENGCLTRIPGGSDLLTNANFDNFVLDLDWKVQPGANSGIMCRVDESDDNTWLG